MSSSTTGGYWLISVPNERNSNKTWDQFCSQTSARGLCEAFPFKVPSKEMKVGTLDTLMALSDDLVKIDTFVEGVVKKCEKTLFDLVDKDSNQVLYVENPKVSPESYLQNFEWAQDRFVPKAPLKELANSIYEECQKTDEDLKNKLTKFADVKTSLSALERKETGSLALKPLEGVVQPKHLTFSGEKEFPMFEAILVAVPKGRDQEWQAVYEKVDLQYQAEVHAKEEESKARAAAAEAAKEQKELAAAQAAAAQSAPAAKDAKDKKKEEPHAAPAASAAAAAAPVQHLTPEELKLAELTKAFEERERKREADRQQRRQQREASCNNVVPRSALQIAEDDEFFLYRVFVLRKGVDLFKAACKDKRFIVRTVDLSHDDSKNDKEKKASLEQEKNNLLASLIKWSKTTYSELFVSWMHIKAIRVFVESVLRYGLPVNFMAVTVKPASGYEKKLRSTLAQMYAHLGGAHLSGGDEESNQGMEAYHPYVSLNVDVGSSQSD